MTGDELRRARQAAGWSQQELGARLTVDGSTVLKGRICDLERGRLPISQRMVARIATAFEGVALPDGLPIAQRRR